MTRILTMNSGSSSIKFSTYSMGEGETLFLRGILDRIGVQNGKFLVRDAEGRAIKDDAVDLPDHQRALRILFDWFTAEYANDRMDAVGHRLVVGDARFDRPYWLTPELLTLLRERIPLAPHHLPHQIAAIDAAREAFPSLGQVACFDTAFHRSMSRTAQIYALPRNLGDQGVLRYGYHGLSYEYIMRELARRAGTETALGRVIIAHLGNGASMAAVRQGRCLDTTMGFTPAGGLVMSTRPGDLDPGVIFYLLEQKGLSAAQVHRMLNRESGLLGVSGMSSDMKDLLARQAESPPAAEAVELFCYQARKLLGSLAAVLGGLDTLVFTGGIGEHAAEIRWRICEGMAFLGLHLDREANDANREVVSPKESSVTVRVMQTNEELMIARHTSTMLDQRQSRPGVT